LAEYRNPQNEPGSEKRLLLLCLLIFAGIALMQYLAPKPPQKPPEQPQKQQAQTQPQQPGALASTTPEASVAAASPAPASPGKHAEQEAETVVESDLYRITFTNRGGLVKSWILKKYKNEQGKPLDMVNPLGVQAFGPPLSLFTYDQNLQKKVNQALYTSAAPEPSHPANLTAPATLTYEYSDGETTAHKSFKFDKSTYVIGVETQVAQKGNLVAAFPAWPAGLGDQVSLTSFGAGERVDWHQNGEVVRKAAQSGNFLTGKKWLVGGETVNGPFEWAAVIDQYFTAAFMPESPRDTALVTFHNTIDLPRRGAEGEKDKASILGAALGGTNGTTRLRMFVGPKAVEVLESVQAQPGGPDLRGILDFGFFGFISRPLFAWLRWTYDHWIPNWGWAIAFLTVVITLALLPLRISGMKSAMKMQKIQPQMKSLQEKYKRYNLTDPRRADMQREMSELYKREGVNPVGGCLPMLLQMPFLFAFYSMLGNATELRLANWLWIPDLSAADPLHILPIGIIITMFITQRSAPQAGMDPTQQKMMMFMTPIMFGVISWNLPSGLGIYWAMSNLIGWAQQAIINRTDLGKQMRRSKRKK